MKNSAILLMLAAGLLLSSCSSRNMQKLRAIESVIEPRPDSALTELRLLDTNKLHTKKEKALYSLLNAMALDKNYIDTADIRVIRPAVEYYVKKGTYDEQLKAYYYSGRIQMNAKNYHQAAVSFSLGERAGKSSQSEMAKGLLYMAFADIYRITWNKDKEKEYVQKGIDAFKKAGDLKHLNLCNGRLAMVYFRKWEWEKADSLYKEGLQNAKEDTIAMSIFLSNYARLKLAQPHQDPVGAISLIKRLSDEYKRPLSISDYGAYAYASSLIGDDGTSEKIVNRLVRFYGNDNQDLAYWLSLIEKHKGNYSKALELYTKSDVFNAKMFDDLLANSVSQSLQDYYSTEVKTKQKESEVLKIKLSLVVLLIVFVFIVALMTVKKNRDKKQKEIERLLQISQESNKILIPENEELTTKLQSLRKLYVLTYKDKFSVIEQLCEAYVRAGNKPNKTDIILNEVEKQISSIVNDERLHKYFEKEINTDLNNIVENLKNDLGGLDEGESRFICYCIAGFSPELIGALLGLSTSNIYTKKFRLKEKIKTLDSPRKEEYLQML